MALNKRAIYTLAMLEEKARRADIEKEKRVGEEKKRRTGS